MVLISAGETVLSTICTSSNNVKYRYFTFSLNTGMTQIKRRAAGRNCISVIPKPRLTFHPHILQETGKTFFNCLNPPSKASGIAAALF